MPSNSLTSWLTSRMAKLDELEAAHQAVGGSQRGRRYATQQINQAYVVMLSSQFQGFCRDLHSECVDFGRFGIQFWTTVQGGNGRVATWQPLLQTLNDWCNAIAHQDFTTLQRSQVRLSEVRRWRAACKGLALTFDHALDRYLTRLAGVRPW